MEREIDLFVNHSSLQFEKGAIIETILAAIDDIGDSFPDGDLSIAILSDSKVAEIHGEFLEDPTETDVITFPGDPEMDFAGEICVSVDRANNCHTQNGTSFSEELTLYIVHGLLHLSGLNDKTEEQSIAMRAGEKKTMDSLAQANQVPQFTFS